MRVVSHGGGGRRPRAPKRASWQCRLRFILMLFLRALAASSGMSPPDLADFMEGRPLCLPPGHPERLVPDLPPTEDERVLWAQLNRLTDSRY
jgi:Family of unknown function (DUF6059)